jgi:hypothetical protein
VQVPDDKRPRLSDVPPLATVCIVTAIIALIVTVLAGAPIQVTGSLAGLITALGLYIKNARS